MRFRVRTFNGRVSRIAPVFDPETRTAEMEIEVPNPVYRLKPGMYARVQLTVSVRPDAITVPSNAVVILSGKPGVFVAGPPAQGRGDTPAPASDQGAGAPPVAATLSAKFMPVETGIRDGDRVEIVAGLRDGMQVVTTGAGALKDGDRIVAAEAEPGQGRGAAAGRPDREGAADEHSAHSHPASGHDVHALGRDHPARHAVAFPSAGRSDAGRVVPEPHRSRRLRGRRARSKSRSSSRARIEQAMSAVAGLERLESTSSEGSSRTTLNFAWGTDLNEAADDVRNRLDRVRGRLPEEADAPVMFKFDSNAMPIMGVGVEAVDGEIDSVTLREIGRARPLAAARARAGRGGGHRRRRPAPADSRRALEGEDHARSTCRWIASSACCAPRTRTSRVGEIDEGDTTYLVRSQGQFENLDQIRDLVVMTRQGVPVYLKDIAEVKDSTEDLRSFTRINGKPGVRMRVTKQSGQNTVEIADAVRVEIERINREMPGLKLTVLDDSSIFIKRSIDAVKEHAMIGAFLVILIIFLFLRDLRSTVIICTSIPISVIGTFALLYFAGYTLNTMTFGGLALGIGMIVDASIVVLENTFRHMEHGKDRMQASIDASEEVWSAILASTLTHIAVFVPLLFLTGVSSILFKQLSIVVMFSLTMSLFVAVTIVPVLCSRLLKLPPPVEQREGHHRAHVYGERTVPRQHGPLVQPADRPRARTTGRPSLGVGVGLRRRGVPHPADDRVRADAGHATKGKYRSPRNCRSAPASSARRTSRCVSSRCSRNYVRGAGRHHHPGGWRRRVRRRQREPDAGHHSPRAEGRAHALERRDRADAEPAAGRRHPGRHHHDARLGRQPGHDAPAGRRGRRWWRRRRRRQPSGARNPRRRPRRGASAWRSRPRRSSTRCRKSATCAIGRDDGRPELAILVDRPKAALLGLGVSNVASSDPDERRRHARRRSSASPATSIRSSCGSARKIATASTTSTTS